MAGGAPSLPSFTGDLAAVEPLSEASRAAAARVMGDGRLFRYSETAKGLPEAAALEVEFAALLGAKYCAAVNSGGGALFLALKAAGVQPGDKVLLNAFTLAPVPGAIAHAGAEAVLVDITEDLTIDLDDLEAKAVASGARFLIASHMRGHFGDLGALKALCDRHSILLIEDCAHATLATCGGIYAGRFGAVGCFSAQSYKHLNAGEGGLLITDDPDIAARAILMSGSYMLYAQQSARPSLDIFEKWKGTCPNFSMRLTALQAAILRPQLPDLPRRLGLWRHIHDRIAALLAPHRDISMPQKHPLCELTPTSLQFRFTDPDPTRIGAALARMAERGVGLKWFGADSPVGFTSRSVHWQYLPENKEPVRSAHILAGLCDLRLPITLSDADCDLIAGIILDGIEASKAD